MNQFRDKKKIIKRKRLIKNLIFLIVFLLLAGGGIFAYSSGIIHYIGRPIWKVDKSISQSFENVEYIIRTKSSVYRDNENLLKENADLKISMIDYQILKDENIKLKESLNRILPKKDFILANILTKPNYSPYDTIIIDIGTDAGLSVGDAIYSNSIVPIGEVSVVYTKTSLITLYSNPGEVTEAMIDGTNTSVELVGRGGGNFEMIIPNDLTFTKGGLVFLPNIQSEVVAIIEEVISRPSDPVKRILLSSPVNVQNLKWVFVKKD